MNTWLRWLQEYNDVLQYRWRIKQQIVETGATRDIFTDFGARENLPTPAFQK